MGTKGTHSIKPKIIIVTDSMDFIASLYSCVCMCVCVCVVSTFSNLWLPPLAPSIFCFSTNQGAIFFLYLFLSFPLCISIKKVISSNYHVIVFGGGKLKNKKNNSWSNKA